MKKLTKLLAITFTAFTVVGCASLRPAPIETRITIAQPPEKVWQTLADFEHYPKWNPFVQEISGSQQVGEQLDVKLGLGEKPMQFTPTILAFEKNEEFRWLGHMGIKGLFDGEHYFLLKQNSKGNTELIHGETFKGIFSGLLMMFIRSDTEQGFTDMNEALKTRVEAENS